jgi:hypothetical protein
MRTYLAASRFKLAVTIIREEMEWGIEGFFFSSMTGGLLPTACIILLSRGLWQSVRYNETKLGEKQGGEGITRRNYKFEVRRKVRRESRRGRSSIQKRHLQMAMSAQARWIEAEDHKEEGTMTPPDSCSTQ